jgi:hypothetical protein
LSRARRGGGEERSAKRERKTRDRQASREDVIRPPPPEPQDHHRERGGETDPTAEGGGIGVQLISFTSQEIDLSLESVLEAKQMRLKPQKEEEGRETRSRGMKEEEGYRIGTTLLIFQDSFHSFLEFCQKSGGRVRSRSLSLFRHLRS